MSEGWVEDGDRLASVSRGRVFGLGGAWFAAESEVRYGSHENYAN